MPISRAQTTPQGLKMAVPDTELSWIINPYNALWSVLGAFVAGIAIVWRFGKKWQTIEDTLTEMKNMEKRIDNKLKGLDEKIKEVKETSNLAVIKLETQLDVLRDEKAAYRIEIAGKYATRDDIRDLATVVGHIRERIGPLRD